ncbi:sigma 54-interacting transcriptional regulator [Gudongella oleilytica]|uniref:sigma 54-interacting transcriptional regulator n=1 Tax=Gudongella oleilytica TaxID=1582259 RepID=UPI000FF8852A|nr:sigma 54-interacting transcriptional regulator [Gudongella oleilytica]
MRIAFISPYTELGDLVSRISKEIGVPIDVFYGAFEEGAKLGKDLEKMGYDIIISRGATYSNISDVVNIPVVNCGISSIDILNSINEATKVSNKIGLVLAEHSPYLNELIKDIFDIELLYKSQYKNINEVSEMVQEAVDKGSEVIVGGIVTKRIAENLGLKSILLKTSYETVKQSIDNAIEIISVSRRQMFQAARFNNILNFSYEGIIGSDASGIVTFFNPAAEKILGIKAVDVIGKKADEHIPTTKLLRVLKTGKEEVGEIQRLNDITILTNRIPIKVKGEIQGVVATFQDISKIQDYELKIRSELYKKGLVAKYTFDDYVGKSDSAKKLIAKAKIYSKSSSTILITGESGTGKEIISQAIHNNSDRKKYPFVAVNCSAIPENLLESELFGYAEGAFTGAKKGGKMGLFELAHKGTIFLDEISSLPISLQSRLLRVLQEKEVWRVGSNNVVNIDVRVIAASNENLADLVVKGKFRNDLLFRLNVLKLETVSLRNKREDIKELFEYFSKVFMGKTIHLSDELMDKFYSYNWPGNVRELKNLVERISLLHEHIPIEEICLDHFSSSEKEDSINNVAQEGYIFLKEGNLRDMQKEIINILYEKYGKNSTILSDRLGVSRTTIWKKLNR